jgi:uncharacterized protein (TIGR01777 family)
VRIVLAGVSGFLGQGLRRRLSEHGNDLTVLVRREPTDAEEARWDPDAGVLDAGVVRGADAVISLSGAGIGDKRWTPDYRAFLRTSRLGPTGTIAAALSALPAEDRPASWLSASAIGYYGERGDQPLPESATAGTGFLADLVAQWEAATAPAAKAGVRVVQLRTGLVLAASGGMLKRLVPLFKLGVGGKLGSGRQYQSWISLADELSAVEYLLGDPSIDGPVNLVAPAPVRNEDFAAELGRVLHRPAFLPAPKLALELVIGGFADEGVLASQRVVCERLADSAFEFQHADLRSALEWAIQH